MYEFWIWLRTGSNPADINRFWSLARIELPSPFWSATWKIKLKKELKVNYNLNRSQYWELCNFALEFIFKHQLFKHLEELLKLDLISDYKHMLLFLKDIFMDIKVNIVEERIKTLTIEGEQMALLGLKLLLDKRSVFLCFIF